jgi:predicted PurR-regulated permease PerM
MRRAALNGLLAAAAAVIIIAGLRAVATVLWPVVLAAFVSVICAPLLHALRRVGLPFSFALTIVLLLLCLIGLLCPLLIGGSLQDLSSNLPVYRTRLQAYEQALLDSLQRLNLDISRNAVHAILDPKQATDLLSVLLNAILRAFSSGVLVLIMVAFILTEAAGLPTKLRMALGDSHAALSQLDEIVASIRRYIAIKTGVSVATGLTVGVALHALGVDFAALWGFLALVMNYIPNIGSLLAAIPAVALALLTDGPGVALAAAIVYAAVNTVFGSILEPRWQGQGLGLSPFVVFVSLFFWGWVLGPVGMLFSAPLTMILKISLDSFPDTRWLAALIGPASAEPMPAPARD